jgi:hypothetical protein
LIEVGKLRNTLTLIGASHFEACIATFLCRFEATSFHVCFRKHRRNWYWRSVLVKRNECQVRRYDVPRVTLKAVFRGNMHTDLHRTSPGTINCGLQDKRLAGVRWGHKIEAVNRGGDAGMAAVTFGDD